MRFDRDSVKLTRQRLEAALKGFGEELGCQVHVGNASFDRDGGYCTFKLELAVVGEGGVVQTKEMSAFRQCAVLYGLKPEDLGAEFVAQDEKYRIIGANPKSGKYPIIGARVKDGKQFKFSEAIVRSALGRTNSPIRGERPVGWSPGGQPPPLPEDDPRRFKGRSRGNR